MCTYMSHLQTLPRIKLRHIQAANDAKEEMDSELTDEKPGKG